MPEVSFPNPFKPLAHWKAIIAPLMRGNKYKLRAMHPVPNPNAIIHGSGRKFTNTKCNSGAKICPTIKIVK